MARSKKTEIAFPFDEKQAADAYEKFVSQAKSLARYEAGRNDKWRGLTKVARPFILSLFPIDQLDGLKRRINQVENNAAPGVSVHLAKGAKEIKKFLVERNLPEPHWMSRNPFLGIIQSVWQDAIEPREIAHEIETTEALPFEGRVGKDALSPEQIADAVTSGKPEDQDKLIEPTPRTANANYVMMSRWAMLVCASIDMNDESILDRNPITALRDYHDWRQKHPTLAIPKITAPRTPKAEAKSSTKGEPTEEEKERSHREFQEKLAQERAAFASGNDTKQEDEPPVDMSKSSDADTPAPSEPEEQPARVAAEDEDGGETTTLMVLPPELMNITTMPEDSDRATLLLTEITKRGIQPSDPTTDADHEIETWVRVKGVWFGPVIDTVAFAVVTRSLSQERRSVVSSTDEDQEEAAA